MRRLPFILAGFAILAMLCAAAGDRHTTVVLPKPDRPEAMVKAGILPRADLTPGAVFGDVTVDQLRVHGYATSVRKVPESVKRQVFREYGMDPDKIRTGDFEVDHLVSLELGGSNDIRNLWIQSYVSHPLNAHVKDKLEDRLAAMVRAGKVDLATAQKEIAGDWTVAYVKYVGPLPK